MKNFFSSSSNRRPKVTPNRRKRLLFSYAPDWWALALFFSLDKVEGYRRVFSLEDTSLRHPFAVHERIPNIALYFICFGAPVILQPIINLLTIRSWWDLHNCNYPRMCVYLRNEIALSNTTITVILGLALTGAATQFVKITVGRPRPDIIDRCQPPAGAVDPTFGLTSWTVCTQTDNLMLRDGFRSFFSGHSSLSFAGLGFLSFYLAGKLHLFDSRGHAGKAWLALTPFGAASLVAISRTMDYRHHWQDVLVGAIVGTVLSYFAYRQYYPSLSSELSHRPYSPRIKREEKEVLPSHQRYPSPTGLPTQPNPFVHQQRVGNGSGLENGAGRYGDSGLSAEYELDGTVPRPGPGSLDEVWRDGEGREGFTSPGPHSPPLLPQPAGVQPRAADVV
ncbi:phosphatidic acid phosphatase type 2/haloperoxidase [Crucibulum laeve]|uniref:Phosphatidic acid phosphatase type 2/haloperoxidase n=1 Tax=Crucibulum laeve TaxID=68775 RepID=A0A5C3MGE3_9AGAR|nr:phosphatidic acid phosphatase type 2/haloperoxidase [Crucibulum laeve]